MQIDDELTAAVEGSSISGNGPEIEAEDCDRVASRFTKLSVSKTVGVRKKLLCTVRIKTDTRGWIERINSWTNQVSE
jgi:hypothetical protein